ncbi:hypothetical protein SUGI_0758480 [Cryptomeria japonica]|nr:hypothetical protein SUGI_0758480 [Cryptomeria japonica]
MTDLEEKRRAQGGEVPGVVAKAIIPLGVAVPVVPVAKERKLFISSLLLLRSSRALLGFERGTSSCTKTLFNHPNQKQQLLTPSNNLMVYPLIL